MGKQSVRCVRLNWDIEFFKDISSGNGFVITEPTTFNLDDTKQKSLYGSRSILYGKSYQTHFSLQYGKSRIDYSCHHFMVSKNTGIILPDPLAPVCRMGFSGSFMPFHGYQKVRNQYKSKAGISVFLYHTGNLADSFCSRTELLHL